MTEPENTELLFKQLRELAQEKIDNESLPVMDRQERNKKVDEKIKTIKETLKNKGHNL